MLFQNCLYIQQLVTIKYHAIIQLLSCIGERKEKQNLSGNWLLIQIGYSDSNTCWKDFEAPKGHEIVSRNLCMKKVGAE